MNTPLWMEPGLSDREREKRKAAFAVARGYRAWHYSGELIRLTCDELAAGDRQDGRHRDGSDQGVDQ